MNSMNQMNKDSNSINITGLTDEEVRQRVEEDLLTGLIYLQTRRQRKL